MVFSSNIFLFYFLPIFLAIYFLFFIYENKFLDERRKYSNIIILIFSLLFYFWGETFYILVLLFSSMVDYGGALLIKKGYRKEGLVLSLSINLFILIFFKYSPFFGESLNEILKFFEFKTFNLDFFKKIFLPLGISFYTFESMSYTIDVYRGEVEVTKKPLNYLLFVTLFPHLVAGPIVRYKDISDQILKRRISFENIYYGISRFIIGLAKKVIIANSVSGVVDKVFAIDSAHLSPVLAWAGVLCYTIQIYFDFSGYSDMAIGLGRILGFRLVENFNYPYFAKSITDFWRRWHISLSTWFRDYLYIPLGGNRCGKIRNFFNLYLVFFLCGLWHGANWTFILWGLYHGTFLVTEKILPEFKNSILSRVYTIFVVMFGWMLFRSENLFQVKNFASKMLFLSKPSIELYNIREFITNDVLLFLILGILFSFPFLKKLPKLWLLEDAFVLVVYVLSLIKIIVGTYNPFIYFRF